MEVSLRRDAVLRVVTVERVWQHSDRLVFKFQGVDTRNEAEALDGMEVCVPLEERPPLGQDEFYLSDFADFEVVDTAGSRIGRVTGWQDYGASPLLQVEGAAGSEFLIPFVKGIWREVDLAGRKIVMDPPEGLLDL